MRPGTRVPDSRFDPVILPGRKKCRTVRPGIKWRGVYETQTAKVARTARGRPANQNVPPDIGAATGIGTRKPIGAFPKTSKSDPTAAEPALLGAPQYCC